MVSNHLWHRSLLATTAIGIGLVTVYSVIDSHAGNRPVADFVFPETIPLASWEQIGNEKIDVTSEVPAENLEEGEGEEEEIENVIQSAKRYQYRGQDTQLEVEVRYLTNTRGSVETLLKQQKDIPPEVLEKQTIEQQDNSGYYSLFQDSDRTYLSSCLNPTGNSTVTQRQFSQNLDRRELNLELLGNWLLGKDSIRDRRCLWVTISLPHKNASLREKSQIVELAWQNLHQWWQPRFPSL